MDCDPRRQYTLSLIMLILYRYDIEMRMVVQGFEVCIVTGISHFHMYW